MIVRLLGPEDVKLHCDAVRALNNCEISIDRSHDLLSEPTYIFVAAIDENGEVMGRIYGYVLHRYEQTDLLLYEVDVVEQHQRKGVGKAMMEFVQAFSSERFYKEMWVLTESDNFPAQALYSSTGGTLESSSAFMYVFNTSLHLEGIPATPRRIV